MNNNRITHRAALAALVLTGMVGGCASMESAERTVRGWAGMDQGLAELDRNDDGVISQDEASANPALSGVFDRIDTNRDSNINPAELNAAYSRVAELDFDEADFNGDGVISEREAEAVRPSLNQVFDRVDSDGDGNVSQSEYQAARLNLLDRTEFASLDTDSDGIIDRDEASQQRVLDESFSVIDIDGDNMISGEEFKQAQSR